MIARLLARLLAPPRAEPEVRRARVTPTHEKEQARRDLAFIDAEIRAMSAGRRRRGR